MENAYGQVPLVTKQLCFVAYIKNMSQKLNIKSIVINSFFARIKVYDEIKNTTLLDKMVEKVEDIGTFDLESGSFNIKIKETVNKTQDVVMNFLKKCLL